MAGPLGLEGPMRHSIGKETVHPAIVRADNNAPGIGRHSADRAQSVIDLPHCDRRTAIDPHRPQQIAAPDFLSIGGFETMEGMVVARSGIDLLFPLSVTGIAYYHPALVIVPRDRPPT